MHGKTLVTIPVAIVALDTIDRESGTNTQIKLFNCCSRPATQPGMGPGPADGLFFVYCIALDYASSPPLSTWAGYLPTPADVTKEKFPVLWLKISIRFSPGCKGDWSTPSWNDRPDFPQALQITLQPPRLSKQRSWKSLNPKPYLLSHHAAVTDPFPGP